MSERIRDAVFPFTWCGWDGDHECLINYDVIFEEDFGPWKKGMKLDSVSIQYDEGRIVQFDDAGKEVVSARFKAQVIGYDGSSGRSDSDRCGSDPVGADDVHGSVPSQAT